MRPFAENGNCADKAKVVPSFANRLPGSGVCQSPIFFSLVLLGVGLQKPQSTLANLTSGPATLSFS